MRTEDRQAAEEAGYAHVVERAMAPLEKRIAELEESLRSIRSALFIRSDISPNAYKRIMEEIEKVLPEITST